MMNTHRAIIQCSVPPSMQLIAAGPLTFCNDRLIAWTEKNPTPQYCRAYIVKVVAEVICEPGVGVYAVTGGIQ